MGMEYFCCYHSYRRKVAKLSDQEVGRLFRALLIYSETGEAQELTGRESVAFDFIADDIDRAKEKYRDRCKTNSENGKAGAEARSERQRNKQTPAKEANACETSQNKTKDKNKSKENIPPIAPQGGHDWGFGEDLTEAFSDWLAYKQEKRQAYKPTGLKSLLTQTRSNVARHGEKAVADIIRQSMANGWQGIIWDRLETKPEKQRSSGNIFADMAREEGLF